MQNEPPAVREVIGSGKHSLLAAIMMAAQCKLMRSIAGGKMHIEKLVAAQPLLTKFAVERQPVPAIGGHYCETRHVWVEETSNGLQPMVRSDVATAGMVTKTLTVQEQDDDHFITIPELVSKTEVQQESDDEITSFSLAELVTKTYLELESDDQGVELL